MTSEMKSPRTNVVIPALLILLSVVPAVAGTARLYSLASGHATAADARFFDSPLPVVLHVLAVVPYSILGAFQFAPALRRKRWHKIAGRFLAPLGFIAAMTGLWMAHFYPWLAGDGAVLYAMRLVVGSVMAASIVVGIAALTRRDYASHGDWMTRAYALGMGAGTQVFTHLPWFLTVGYPDEAGRIVAMGSAWVINAAVAEFVIRRSRARVRPSPSIPAPTGWRETRRPSRWRGLA